MILFGIGNRYTPILKKQQQQKHTTTQQITTAISDALLNVLLASIKVLACIRLRLNVASAKGSTTC